MFPKKNKINKRCFSELLQSGHSVHSENLSFRYMKDSSRLGRYAFVVSKKTAKTAIVRNMLRRRGFHLLREISVAHPDILKNGFSGAFFLKKGSEKIDREVFSREIQSLLRSARILV